MFGCFRPSIKRSCRLCLVLLVYSAIDVTRRIGLVLLVYSAIYVNMKGKPTSSNEHKPSDSQQSLFKHTVEAIKKEWVDFTALENPRCPIIDYSTIGCTKNLMGRGKRLIIIDCISENWPISGALWTFSTESKTRKGKSYNFEFIETSVAEGKAPKIQNNQTQEEQMTENAPSTSSKEAKNKSSDHHITKKTLAANMMKSPIEDGNTEEEEASIMTDFDYHDTINAERYEKYFETICKLLKPNSVIIIDNANYHSRNVDNFPVSKWRKGQFQYWLKENKVPFRPDALRSQL